MNRGMPENIEAMDAKEKQLRKALAGNVIRLRKLANLTQPELAQRAGISQASVSRIENETWGATLEGIAGLAKAFNCEAWMLLADSDATREAALQHMLWGPAVTPERAAQFLPPAPKSGPRKKKSRKRPEN